MSAKRYLRGSEWNKWDLHVHTPASIVQNYGIDNDSNWEKFIIDLENLPESFKVIGINDYLFIDGYQKVLEYKAHGRLQNIDLFLPVIEFRLNKFVGTEGRLKKINLHIIFADDSVLSPNIIQQQFLNGISPKFKLTHGTQAGSWSGLITKQSLEDLGHAIKSSVAAEKLSEYGSDLEEGFNNLTVDEEDIFELLQTTYFNKDRERLYLTAIGKTEWESLKWNDSSIATKKDLINKFDLVFTSSESIENYYHAKKKLGENKVNDLLLDCSDAHNYSNNESTKDRIGKCFTWIKADPTFEGLKQILYEPAQRIIIGNKPDKLSFLKDNGKYFIDSIYVESSKDDGEWFDKIKCIPLNSDLITIIGNKGTGKSALADLIGAAGNANTQSFSFLKHKKFLDHKSVEKYKARLVFHDKYDCSKLFCKPSHIEEELSKVIYFSQSFVNDLCDNEDTSRLRNEIERVVYSHIPFEKRLNTDNLEVLIEKKSSILDKNINRVRSKLDETNKEISRIEHNQLPHIKEKVKNSLKEKIRQLDELKKQEPPKVDKPTEKESELVLHTIKTKQDKIDNLNKENEKYLKIINELNNEIHELERLLGIIDELQNKYIEVKEDILNSAPFLKYKLKIEESIQLKINHDPINNVIRQLTSNVTKYEKLVSDNTNQLETIQKEVSETEKGLSQKQINYTNYLKEFQNWKKKEEELIGEKDKKDSIRYYEYWSSYFENDIDKEHAKKITERNSISREILSLIKEKMNIYPDIYSYAKKYSEQRAKEFDFDINEFLQFDSNLAIDSKFDSSFYDFINLKTAGTFRTYEKAESQLEIMKRNVDFSNEASILEFPDRLLEALQKDYSKPGQKKSDFEAQIIEGKKTDFYNYIYGFTYLEPRFNITFAEKPISFLSPGEKGTLLLIFYLLIDKDKRPIIIDQPEENLDNETVAKKLVPFLKTAKTDRQIIMVTHNPNLAVVCDSEQIIFAKLDKKNNHLITYDSGSIENFGIRQRVIDVLEGTKEAFNNRERKYSRN